MKKIGVFLIFLIGINSYSQKIKEQTLLERANETFELLTIDPKSSFQESKIIKADAIETDDKEAELRAINIQVEYYRLQNDFENMIESAKTLNQKALLYQYPIYQAIAKNELFTAYIFVDLADKALNELRQGLQIMNNTTHDSLAIITRANLLVGYSNYYSHNNDHSNRLKYLKLSGKEIEQLSESDYKRKLLYTHYANIGMGYKNINVDSTRYYINLSLSKYKDGYNDEVKSLCMSVLGEIALKEKNYKEALSYFQNAEKLGVNKNHLNLETLYDNIIDANINLGYMDLASLYQLKKDSLSLNIIKNQNKSLHRLLNEKKDEKNLPLFYFSTLIILSLFVVLFLIIRKNKIVLRQEKINQYYLETVSNNPSGKDYSNLIEILKKNDSTFLFYFEEIFPEFIFKLKKINPNLSPSEMEFCALLKLKLSTKEIATYKYLQPKTVRNRKYLIRKRLEIPKGIDIYEWIDEL